MNSKKYFIMITTLMTFLVGLNTNLWGQEQKDPNDKNKLLEEKIKTLENVVEAQRETIGRLKLKLDEQTKENERLKKLCSQAGIDISPQKDKKPSNVEDANFSNVRPTQLYELVHPHQPLTRLQKEEFYKNNCKGKWIQWTGMVDFISSLRKGKKDKDDYYEVRFIHYYPGWMPYSPWWNSRQRKSTPWARPPDYPMNVSVKFSESQKQNLLLLNKGAIVTYQAKLPDDYIKWSNLTDGIIISVGP